jgi:hypothetical protein
MVQRKMTARNFKGNMRSLHKKSIARKSERRHEPAVCKYGGFSFYGAALSRGAYKTLRFTQ